MTASPNPPERATPLLRASLWLHGAAVLTTVAQPHWWPWTAGAVVGDHLVLTACGLLPRCNWLGSNWTRLPQVAATGQAVAITLDDGPDPQVTPRVLEILAAHGARASFFCVGERVRRHPGLTREMIAAGHSVENHSQHHARTFSLLGPAGMAREVRTAQDLIAAVTGRAPRFFRAPAGLRNPFLAPVLSAAGLQLASWTRRGFDTLSGDSARVLSRLTRGLAPRDILLLHDGGAARDPGGTPVVLTVLPQLLAALRAQALLAVALPESLIGVSPGASATAGPAR